MANSCEFLPSDPALLNDLHLMHPSAFPGQIQPLGNLFRVIQVCSRALRSRRSLFICWQLADPLLPRDFTGKGGATLQRVYWPWLAPGELPLSVGWALWFHGFGKAAGGRSSELLQVRGVWRWDAPKELLVQSAVIK